MDVVTGITVGVATLAILTAALVLAGFVVLFRRRGTHGTRPADSTAATALETNAASTLVRLDDSVRAARDEAAYAIAQFGPDAARPYTDAVNAASAQLSQAFRLRQALDDANPDSASERREWTLQIVALCDQAAAALSRQDAAFGTLREREAKAPGTLAGLRDRIAAGEKRLVATRVRVSELSSRYAASAITSVVHYPDEAEIALANARGSADAAAPAISESGVNAVSTTLQDAERHVRDAEHLFDAVDRAARDLAAASAALQSLRAAAVDDLAEARIERDRAPDAASGKAIIDAIASVEASIGHAGDTDPVTQLDRMGAAIASLDNAMAVARNESQRRAHAEAAYDSTLVSATSQIAVTQRLIRGGRGGVDARTRLAEAERQFAIATAQDDPVDALDTIRRVVTLAQDADALARYDLIKQR